MAEEVPGMKGWTFAEQKAPTSDPSDDSKSGTNTALALATLGKAVPSAAWEAMRFATSPNVTKIGSAVGQAASAIASPVVGTLKGGPLGALAGAAEMGKAGWVGGGLGWGTAKLAQKAAMPVAKALNAAAPYAQTLSTIAGAQGVNDLAQMAEPGRKDIGVLGVGPSADNTPSPEALKQIPAAVNAVKFLIAQGAAPADAVKQVTGGNPALMGPVMMALMQTRQVK